MRTVIDKGGFRTRKTLEAWYTKLIPNADTIYVHYLDNITFFLTNIHNLHFHYFAISRVFIHFFLCPSFLAIYILPAEDCSSGSRKLVIF